MNRGDDSATRHKEGNGDEKNANSDQSFIFGFHPSQKSRNSDGHGNGGVIRRKRTRRQEFMKESFFYFGLEEDYVRSVF